MATLELYINKTVGGLHTFIKVDGLRRIELDVSDSSIDEMLSLAHTLLAHGGDYEPRMRIYDMGRRMVQHGDGMAWVTLAQLKAWTQPGGTQEPRPNEAILGKPTDALKLAA